MSDHEYDIVQDERLPTLYEVLVQKTVPPVDLWAFYTFLSQFPYAINYLEFWIDLMVHTRLCKDYITSIRESLKEDLGRRSRNVSDHTDGNGSENVAVEDVDSVTSSVLLDVLMNEGYLDFDRPERVTEFLQGGPSYSPQLSQLLDDWRRHSGADRVLQDEESVDTDENSIQRQTNEKVPYTGNKLASAVDNILQHRRPQPAGQPRITTKQLLSNAVQICDVYLSSPQDSPKYLTNVPEETRNKVLQMVKTEYRHDPEVFEEMKALAYQFLEMDCFPKFLGRIALHNLHDQISDWRFHSAISSPEHPTNRKELRDTRHHSRSPFSNYTSVSRVCLGLLWLGIGFWIGYVLIFLDYDRGIRVTTIVPFVIGCYFIVCGIYQVDIIYSWLGVTQELLYKHKQHQDAETASTLPRPTSAAVPGILKLLGGNSRLVKIEHGFIRQTLFKRGLWCCFLTLVGTAIFTVIFSCVPSRKI